MYAPTRSAAGRCRSSRRKAPERLSLVYREGGAADLPAVFELNRQALPEAWSFEGLQHSLRDGYDLDLCMDGDELAGYMLSHVVLDEVHIMQIAVASGYRRRGIAETLSRNLISGRAGKLLLLEVRASNLAAQSLYEKLGFVRTGIRRKYYVSRAGDGEREDAVLMSLAGR